MGLATLEFKPLSKMERNRLIAALRSNGEEKAILLTDRNTSFAGAVDALPDDAEIVSAIKSVPCHY